jgi:hypothetical protein
MKKIAFSLAALAVLAGLHAAPTQAQPIRTFVALTGADSNPCTFASPCKSAQHAHDVVAAGGEIRMLDPGSYGLLTITKAISILGDGHGGIAASGGADAITVNAGTNDKINLRGLVIEGFGTGNNGIIFNTGASLNIQDSIIRNFTTNGIHFLPTAASQLNVSQTLVSDLSAGAIAIFIVPFESGTADAVLDHVELDHGSNGLVANGDNTSGTVKVAIADSAVNNFGNFGIDTFSNSGATQVMVRNCTVSNNGTGLVAKGSSALLRVTRSTITANDTGFGASNGATLSSYGDNNLDGNTTDGAPTSTIGYH